MGSRDGPLRAVEPALGRFSVDALEVPRAELALEVARDLPVDLIIVSYPIESVRIDRFVRLAQAADLGLKGTRVLLLAPSKAVERLRRYADAVLSVVAVDQPAPELELELQRHLRRAPRLPGTKMVKIEIGGEGRVRRRVFQTENLSESGMFMRCRDPIEPGTEFDFELALTLDTPPLRGRAQVVRIAMVREGRSGVGVHFTELDLAARRRLAEFIRGKLPPTGSER